MKDQTKRKKLTTKKILFLIPVAMLVFGLIWYLVLSTYYGRNVADIVFASFFKSDIVLKDSKETVSARSYHSFALYLPYSGNLQIKVQSTDKQLFSTYLVKESDYSAFNSSTDNLFGGKFPHISDFHLKAKESMSGFAVLEKGLYYLIVENEQLGLLSDSFMTVSVFAELKK